MSHFSSVFNNSCVKVPLDPSTKMPITDYDRKMKRSRRTTKTKRRSVDSCSSDYSITNADTDAKQVREFFESIPDYKDVDHLTQEEFYATLRALREKKKQMLGYSVAHIDDDNGHRGTPERILVEQPPSEEPLLQTKEQLNLVDDPTLKNSIKSRYDKGTIYSAGGLEYSSNIKKITDDIESILTDGNVIPDDLPTNNDKPGPLSDCEIELKTVPARELSPKTVLNIYNNPKEPIIRSESRSKRNHSACSISWNDQCTANIPDDVDNRFDKYFSGAQFTRAGKERKSRSMPTSPVKVRRRRSLSPDVYRKNAFTVPKPFKMTLRDEDERMSTNLKSLTKSFSDEMLHRKSERRGFKARPVPIESRIPLYDKIMEDQAMRFQDVVELSKPHAAVCFIIVCERAISKINSTAELQAQMKPFSFTERDELRPRHTCDRHDPATATAAAADKLVLADKKKFRARPIPKNIFSNYVFEKMKEDEFYRALKRRIRAEELLRNASLPPSMAARDKSACRSRMSTPGGLLSDLPTDTNSELSSNKSKRNKSKRPVKNGKRGGAQQQPLRDFITTSPEPFHLSTASRARSKESAKKLYSKRSISPLAARSASASALEMPSVNRSNLAAVLRIESTKKRLDEEVERQLAEQEHRAELRWRDHVLRKKPAWQLVKNNCEEDIAMRLQTRRDEERLRREEFLHEMELMYGRVRNQPLLFERYYSPSKSSRDILESFAHEMDISLKKSQRRKNSKKPSKSSHLRHIIPSDPKVSKIPGGSKENLLQYLNKMEDEEKLFSDADSLSDDNSDKND